MKIKCLAIDDEPYALQQISRYISDTPFLELAGKCSSAVKAMDVMTNIAIDLFFIDINLPEMSGMDFAKSLPSGSAIVFTTAYSQYAAESYKVNAIDYLLKPTSYDDFLRSANKALRHFSLTRTADVGSENKDHFFVNANGKIIRISFQDIDYIESMSEYVKICLKNKTQVVTLMRLKNLDEFLPGEQFMRVHRSFIVNTKNINTIERNRIVFYGDTFIPVSEAYKAEFKKFIDNNFLE